MKDKELRSLEELKKEYYDWTWKDTKPSDDPHLFWPRRTNKEISDFWIEKIKLARQSFAEEIVDEIKKKSWTEDAGNEVIIVDDAIQIIKEKMNETL